MIDLSLQNPAPTTYQPRSPDLGQPAKAVDRPYLNESHQTEVT